MRLFIVAALFLIFSPVCASPVYGVDRAFSMFLLWYYLSCSFVEVKTFGEKPVVQDDRSRFGDNTTMTHRCFIVGESHGSCYPVWATCIDFASKNRS